MSRRSPRLLAAAPAPKATKTSKKKSTRGSKKRKVTSTSNDQGVTTIVKKQAETIEEQAERIEEQTEMIEEQAKKIADQAETIEGVAAAIAEQTRTIKTHVEKQTRLKTLKNLPQVWCAITTKCLMPILSRTFQNLKN